MKKKQKKKKKFTETGSKYQTSLRERKKKAEQKYCNNSDPSNVVGKE
jgi:hypothetical protein